MSRKRKRCCFEVLEPRCLLNSAPVLDPSGIARFAMIGKGIIDAENTGHEVQSVINSVWPLNMITDADAGALRGIAVTAANKSLGTWQFSIDGAPWSNVGDVSESQALLLRAEDRLRFVPDGLSADTATATFRAWDQTGATAGQQGTKMDAGTPGGTSPFSAATETASITVAAAYPVYIPTDIIGAPGSVVTVPLMIAEANGLLAADITINYDTDLLDATNADVKVIDSVWPSASFAANVDDSTGTIIVSISKFPALGAGGGKLMTIAFTIKNTAPVGTHTKIDLEEASLNEGHITYHPTPQKGDDPTDGEITIVAPNHAPVLDPSGNATFSTITEDDINNAGNTVQFVIGSVLPLDMITDSDQGALEGFAITGVDGGRGEWQFSIDAGASWSDVGSVSDTQALLLRPEDKLRFVPDAKNADTGAVTFRAWDQSGDTAGKQGTKVPIGTPGGESPFSAATETAGIIVTAVNDAPVLDPSGDPTLTTISEDDIDNQGNTVQSIINSVTPLDMITDVDTGAVEGIAVIGANPSQGKWQFSTDGGTSWTDLGSPADADGQRVLLRLEDKLRFVPDGKNADTASVTFRAWDQSGTTGTPGGTSPFSAATETAIIAATAVNDAPVLDPSAHPVFSTITEDETGNTGNTVESLIAGIVTDVDQNALRGIAVTGATNGRGKWQFSTDAGANWTDVGAVSDSQALLLRAEDRLRFVPDAKNADTANVSSRAWDQTGATAGKQGTKVDIGTPGGTSPFSTASATADITVTALNDSPVLDPSGSPVFTTITEDDANNSGNTVQSLLDSVLPLSVITDVDNGAIQGIALTGLNSGRGKWQFSIDAGASWSDVGAVSDTQALLLRPEDKLRFVPDGKNADAASITFRAWDQTGATAGKQGTKAQVDTPGGTSPFSTATETAGIAVTAVNDAPVLDASGNPTLTSIGETDTDNSGNTVRSIIDSVLPLDMITDVDTGAVDGIAITATNKSLGNWQSSTNGGTTWTDVGDVSDSQALLLRPEDKLRFVPDGKNSDTATVTFRAWDQTGTTTGQQGTKVAVGTPGGTSPFSTATETASISVGQMARVSGFVYADTNRNSRADANEGVPGVKITLTNSATGEKQDAWTDDNGWYEFRNLPAGTYQISERQPAALADGGANTISGIQLGGSDNKTGQNFRELGLRPEYMYNRLLATSTYPVGSEQWCAVIRKIIADAEKKAGNTVDPAPPVVTQQVLQQGNKVVVRGTNGNDSFEFIPGTTKHTVVLNGETRELAAVNVDAVFFDGGLGKDTARVVGTAGKDAATLSPTFGTVKGGNYDLRLSAFEQIQVDGVSGSDDQATLLDSFSDDTLTTAQKSATLSGYYFSNQATNFATVVAQSQSGGYDVVNEQPHDFVLIKQGNWISQSSSTSMTPQYLEAAITAGTPGQSVSALATAVSRSAGVADPADTADRRSPQSSETSGLSGGSVGRPATARGSGNSAVASIEAVPLAEAELKPIVAEAIGRWDVAGFVPEMVGSLPSVEFAVTDLPGTYLGAASGTKVEIDEDAAGHGWFVDATPDRDEEFAPVAGSPELYALAAEATGRMDLLTVVEHELGHVAGLADRPSGTGEMMSGQLAAGVRRVSAVSAEAEPLSVVSSPRAPNAGRAAVPPAKNRSPSDTPAQHVVLPLQAEVSRPGVAQTASAGATAKRSVVGTSALAVQPHAGDQNVIRVLQTDTPLPANAEFRVTFHPKSTDRWRGTNALIVFDYRSPTDFKYAGAFVSINRWAIGHVTERGYIIDRIVPAAFQPGTDYRLALRIEGATVSLAADGIVKLSHTFPETLQEDRLGVLSWNDTSQFDDLSVGEVTAQSP